VLRADAASGASGLHSIGCPNVYKRKGWEPLRSLLPLARLGVLGVRLGRAPLAWIGDDGSELLPGQEDSGSGGLRSVVAGSAEPRWMYQVPVAPSLSLDADTEAAVAAESGEFCAPLAEEGCIVTVISVPAAFNE